MVIKLKLKWFFVMDIDLFEYMVDRYVSFVLLEDLLFVKLYLYRNKIYFEYIYIWFILICK